MTGSLTTTKTMRLPCCLLLLVISAAVTCGAQSFADLDAGLRSALLRDAACVSNANAGDGSQLLKSEVGLTNFRGDRQAGVVVVPRGACPCASGNCATFVYLKSGDDYHLAFARNLASLRPMRRGFHHGLPDLSGKIQVSDSQSETVVYEWDGSGYRPTLCATVTQRPGQKRPAIVKHGCDKLPPDRQIGSKPD
jgi:hypothetical protein